LGKYLAEEMPTIYGEQAAAVVMVVVVVVVVVVVFVSGRYAVRDWT
jgi:hypothetical protein